MITGPFGRGGPRDPDDDVRRKLLIPIVTMVLLAFIVLPLVAVLKIHARETGLRKRGINVLAQVVGVDHTQGYTNLRVRFAAPMCMCVVGVRTNNEFAHPVGSSILVRYDPLPPHRVIALVDRPNPYAVVFPQVATFGLSVAILLPLVLMARARRRRSLKLLHGALPLMQVRIEAWRRVRGNAAVPYLSLFRIGTAPSGDPLLVVSVSEGTIKKLRAGQVFSLYGDGKPGSPLALRAGTLTIISPSKSRPGSWETGKRGANTDIELPPLPGTTLALTSDDRPLFADDAEARAFQKNARQMGWIFPIFGVVALIRLLPDRLIGWGLVVVVLMAGAVFWLIFGWRRRIDRIARRWSREPVKDRVGRRAARMAVAQKLGSPSGRQELARRLGTTVQALQREETRAARRMYVGLVILLIGLVVVIVRLAIS